MIPNQRAEQWLANREHEMYRGADTPALPRLETNENLTLNVLTLPFSNILFPQLICHCQLHSRYLKLELIVTMRKVNYVDVDWKEGREWGLYETVT